MKPSSTARSLPTPGRKILFEREILSTWFLIIFIGILAVVAKEFGVWKIHQYHTERAPILPDATAQVERLFKTWSALTPGLDLDSNRGDPFEKVQVETAGDKPGIAFIIER